MKPTKAQNDFIILILAYIVLVVVVLMLTPIGGNYFVIAVLLVAFSGVIQAYWNRNLKS